MTFAVTMLHLESKTQSAFPEQEDHIVAIVQRYDTYKDTA